MTNKRKYSSKIVDGIEQAPSRAMLHAVGFEEEDFSKVQVGIASTWSMVTPCNMHINALADAACMGTDEAGGKSVLFNTITVSDGISMGTPGMRYSLVSREIIADSIEAVVGAQGFDGFVAIGGCDKNMPACAIAMARMDRPSVFVYGGTIQMGAERRDIVSVFEAVGGRYDPLARVVLTQRFAGIVQLHNVERAKRYGPVLRVAEPEFRLVLLALLRLEQVVIGIHFFPVFGTGHGGNGRRRWKHCALFVHLMILPNH